MRNKENCLSLFLELFKFVIALSLEEYVSNRKRLINYKNLGIDVYGNRKRKSHKHTA